MSLSFKLIELPFLTTVEVRKTLLNKAETHNGTGFV
jgi:hypothetical protein